MESQVRKLTFGLLLLISGLAYSLPDIPSFHDCPDLIHNSGFQNQSQASLGVGGLAGSQTHVLFSQGANRTYYTYAPTDYDSNKAYPLLFVWHGQAGAGTAQINAEATRNFWLPSAQFHQFIVLAQAGTGSSGGWNATVDLQIFADILSQVKSLYNIENTRIYGEGFSAGAHLLHSYILDNALDYAGYIVRAGTLQNGAGVMAPSDAQRVVPLYISVGSTDPFRPVIESEQIHFINTGWEQDQNYWLDVFNGGHEHDVNVIWDSWEQLCLFSNLN